MDVVEFRACVAAKDFQTAAALYAGPFVEGFYLAEAADFERWVEDERSSLARDGTRAIEASARAMEAIGRWDEAAQEWHRLTRLDSLSSRFATSYKEALANTGDRTAALAHGRMHADVLRRELGAEPDPSFQRLVARLRDQKRPSPAEGKDRARTSASVADEEEETDVARGADGARAAEAIRPQRRLTRRARRLRLVVAT